MKTKKVGSTGRFGARYGRKIKLRVRKIEEVSKAKHPCPKCSDIKVKRVSAGIWKCAHCNAKFTGGAYSPVQKVKKLARPVVTSVDEYEAEKTMETETQIPKEEEKLNG